LINEQKNNIYILSTTLKNRDIQTQNTLKYKKRSIKNTQARQNTALGAVINKIWCKAKWLLGSDS